MNEDERERLAQAIDARAAKEADEEADPPHNPLLAVSSRIYTLWGMAEAARIVREWPVDPPRLPSVLRAEVQEYLRLKPELLKMCEGKFIVLKGTKMIGPFDSFNAAYKAGLKTFGRTAMLVRQVQEREPVVYC